MPKWQQRSGFNPIILQQCGIYGAADEAVLNNALKGKIQQNTYVKINLDSLMECAECTNETSSAVIYTQ